MAGAMEIDRPGNYKIVLSDALLGKGTKEVFTGIQCIENAPLEPFTWLIRSMTDNHKPPSASDRSLISQELKPSTSGDKSQFNLSYTDGSNIHQFQGMRNSGDGQYILVFDPVKEHFVLHQVDSTFEMNLKSTSKDQDSATRSQTQSTSPKLRRKSSSQPKSKATQSKSSTADVKKRKVERPKKAKTPPREPTPDAEDEDSDDGLTIEYPGGPPPPHFPALPRPSLLSQNLGNEQPSDESDADAEYEEDDDNDRNRDVDVLELPSPAANMGNADVEMEDDEEDLDLDLAAELEQELEKETGRKADDESSESEEE